MIPGWTTTEVWSLVLLFLLLGGYLALGRRIAAFLAARCTVFIIPKSGDVVEVRGRLRGDRMTYSFAGAQQTAALGPQSVRTLRRRLRKRNAVFVDGVNGVPYDFDDASAIARHLWADRVAAMARTLGSIALRRAKSGPFGELAPYIPLMMLMLLAMVGALLFASGKSNGWW